ncbi:hypothetical protein [Vibrio phage VP4B]|uniref:Uncharacterized protein n=1 Tax=Vibrio phage VP4B TaxID=1262540 RepID=V9LZF0_9CAUD|nr:internal head protein [Vibrio phage VP4B]AGB07237.1 hypothetical protein [Vibrio phage VP4B]
MSQIRNMLMAQAGMESLDAAEVAQVEKTAEEVAELVADKAAEEIKAEVNELADEVEELSEEIEEIEEDVEELEECVDGMEALLKAGSFNGAAFGLLYNRAEKLNRKLGGAETGAVVGAESLGDATSATLAARAGMEGFMETARGYKDAAVKFIMSMYESLKSFVKGLFDKSVAIENQVKATTARLEKAEKMKEDVKPGKWASLALLRDSNKLRAIVTAADAVVSAGAKLTANDVAGYAGAYRTLKNAIENLAKDGQSKANKSGDGTTHQIHFGKVVISATVFDGEIKELADVNKAAKVTTISYSVAKQEGEVSFNALTKESAKGFLKSAAADGVMLKSMKEAKAGNEKGRDELVAALKKVEGKQEDWVKPSISALKASTAMTNRVFTVVAKILGNVADAKIAAVKAYL